jgi:hypothetical protein
MESTKVLEDTVCVSENGTIWVLNQEKRSVRKVIGVTCTVASNAGKLPVWWTK